MKIGEYLNVESKVTEFIQHFGHDIEDEEGAEQYLDESLPFVGIAVMYFNTLEKSVDSVIYEKISDRSDFRSHKISDKILQQEYVQLSPEALEKILGKIGDVHFQLSHYHEERGDLFWYGKCHIE